MFWSSINNRAVYLFVQRCPWSFINNLCFFWNIFRVHFYCFRYYIQVLSLSHNILNKNESKKILSWWKTKEKKEKFKPKSLSHLNNWKIYANFIIKYRILVVKMVGLCCTDLFYGTELQHWVYLRAFRGLQWGYLCPGDSNSAAEPPSFYHSGRVTVVVCTG